MALKTKAITVTGETSYQNGLTVRNLGQKVEKAIDAAVAGLNPNDIVDIKINSEFSGVGGDSAFVLILYKTNEVKEEKVEEKTDEREVKKHWNKK